MFRVISKLLAETLGSRAVFRVSSILRVFCRDRRGSAAVFVGLTLTVLVGGVGLGMDVGSWYHTKRQAYSAADAAAYAGALNLARQGLDGSANFVSIEDAGRDAAARNSFAGTVTINHPPQSGIAAGDARAVEAVLTVTAQRYLSAVMLDQSPRITVRAVARAIVSEACVWALDPAAEGALKVSGSAQVDLDCGVVVNSSHPDAALYQTGSSCLTSTSVAVSGGSYGDCVTPQPETYTAAFHDPFAGMSPPPEAGDPCDFPAKVTVSPGTTATLTPGVYCGGLDLRGDVTFAPGNYVLRSGQMKVTSQAIITNTENAFGGASFYLTGSGGNYAQVDIAGGAHVTLTPTTSGSMANMLFFQDPAAPPNATNKIAGGSTMDLTGILYFPNQAVQFTGGSAANEADILLVARTVDFSGNSYVSASYASSLLPGEYYARLIE